MAAIAIEAGLALLVIVDAGAATGLAGAGAGFAVALLAITLATGSEAALDASLAALGLILVARASDRLILAPLYGGALLAVSELARTCHELRHVDRIGPSAIRMRLTAAAASAGLGGCAAALVAVAVAGGPTRSVAISVAGTAAVGLAYGGLVALARRGQPRDTDPAASTAAPASREDAGQRGG